MDTDLHPAVPNVAENDAATSQPNEAGRASAIIGSEAFVERVLRAMPEGARRAVAENAALEKRPAKS